MKKILFALIVLLIVSVRCFSQSIETFSIKARLVQTLVKYVKGSDDTAFINLYHRWVKAYDVPNPPNGTTQVSVDSISINVIAACYSKCLSYPQGAASVGDDFKADIATIRGSNSQLDTLLDAIDARFGEVVPNDRTDGKRILTGRNN